jgi:hypothetical protein
LIALQHLGLSAPADVALASFDDAPWMCIANPPLTVLRQPNYEMGILAGQLLLQQLRGEIVPRTTITLQPELIIRQSCRADRHRMGIQPVGAAVYSANEHSQEGGERRANEDGVPSSANILER